MRKRQRQRWPSTCARRLWRALARCCWRPTTHRCGRSAASRAAMQKMRTCCVLCVRVGASAAGAHVCACTCLRSTGGAAPAGALQRRRRAAGAPPCAQRVLATHSSATALASPGCCLAACRGCCARPAPAATCSASLLLRGCSRAAQALARRVRASIIWLCLQRAEEASHCNPASATTPATTLPRRDVADARPCKARLLWHHLVSARQLTTHRARSSAACVRAPLRPARTT